MRHHDRSKPAHRPRRATAWLSLLAGVSVLAMMAAGPARAQDGAPGDDFVVDVSDPNVSIDLSVLDDGGIAPQMGGPMSTPTSGGGLYQAPGANMPVSTLYIKPMEDFVLPPQTKTLIAEPAPQSEPQDELASDVAEDAPMTAELQAETQTEPQAEAEPEAEPESVAEAMPEPEPVPAAPEQVAAPAAPAPMPEPVQETATAAPEPTPPPALEVATPAVPSPAPVKEMAKTEPAPAPAPPQPVAEPAPAPKVAAVSTPQADTAPQMPPPPPQALTTPQAQTQAQTQAPTPGPIDETQTAPKAAPMAPAKSGAVVVDLPPRLEETQPGIASLPSASGPLADGDTMRIVFEHDSSKLPGDARDALKALSDRMSQQDTLRLQLLAYAGDTNTSASAARRLSLSRALAVRSYLIENGVRSTRIDVRALGNKSTEAVTERVDITVVER